MGDQRWKNIAWVVGDKGQNELTLDYAKFAVMLDIRDELQTLNRLLACRNFVGIPDTLRRIEHNLAVKPIHKPRKRVLTPPNKGQRP